MTEPWLGVVEKITEFFATAQVEACARQTGFVRRTSKLTGKVFLALVTLGAWSTRRTSLGQLAAKGAQLPRPVAFSPEALHQRMTQRAVAFLRALLQQAFAQFHTGDVVCDAELFAPFSAVHIADSTGFALPPALTDLFPGSGGGASTAGAKLQLVWEYLSHSFVHLALVAGTLPDNKYIDTVVRLAQRGALFLFDLGYFKVTALAQIVEAEASFLTASTTRRHSTPPWVAGCVGWSYRSCYAVSPVPWSSTRCTWGPVNGWPCGSWPCGSRRQSSMNGGAKPARRRRNAATPRPSPISRSWPGICSSRMSQEQSGRPPPSAKPTL